ncbi:hypothetical protein [Arthrobacter alkaliphilus]
MKASWFQAFTGPAGSGCRKFGYVENGAQMRRRMEAEPAVLAVMGLKAL